MGCVLLYRQSKGSLRTRQGAGAQNVRGKMVVLPIIRSVAQIRFREGGGQGMSQDTLPSLLAIGSLTKYYYSYCTTSDVYTTPVSTSGNTVITIAFSNTVRAERSEDRHRMTPIGVLHKMQGRDPPHRQQEILRGRTSPAYSRRTRCA